ncbi:MAG: endonuclease [Sporichthyaceae bacterium]
MAGNDTRYGRLMAHIFDAAYSADATRVPFTRDDIVEAAATLGEALPKNLGDVVYSVRYRYPLPPSILDRAPEGKQWVIRGTGRGAYEFAAVRENRVVPTVDHPVIEIPDATPQILLAHKLGDEQALLAIMRYNRLIDVFLGITAYSLQNHLRTTVAGIGQVEIDELYVGVDRHGAQYVVPVQAKGGTDQIGIVQTEQDLAMCAAKFPKLIARPVSAQFMADDVVALFELSVKGDEIEVVDEKHYRLVTGRPITDEDLEAYALRTGRIVW